MYVQVTGRWVTDWHLIARTAVRVRARHEAEWLVGRGNTALLEVSAVIEPRRNLKTVFFEEPGQRASHLRLDVLSLEPGRSSDLAPVEVVNGGWVKTRIKLPCPEWVTTKRGFLGFGGQGVLVPNDYSVAYCVSLHYADEDWDLLGTLLVPTVYPEMADTTPM
jgi:hypothetical protein